MLRQAELKSAYDTCTSCVHSGRIELGSFNEDATTLVIFSQPNVINFLTEDFDRTYAIRCNVENIQRAYVACGVYTLFLARMYSFVIVVGDAALKQLQIDDMSPYEIREVMGTRYLFLKETTLINITSERKQQIYDAIQELQNE